MAFIVSRRPNAGYAGKHKAAATALVKKGTRVGIVVVDPATAGFFCHVCNKEQPKPMPMEKVDGLVDHLGPCGGCGTPFIFWDFR